MTETVSWKLFDSAVPPAWIVREVTERDYGVDSYLEICETEYVTGDLCSVQRDSLDELPKQAYFLREEEVPRAGVVVTESFQRTRWRDRHAWVWLGVRKQTGRGEGSSGLAFDRIVDVPPSP